ncbi:hypothetical protein THRCLA_22047 [Thraustotheca clavata]|uniref:UBL3-like ubiquitin domain-containing protein n=1 Tax=Thraustotheca clavata TaxID=74557 RepID=A0A1V9ZD72_9STRA|nr:hypothetical protein THRCLA_22047 [Thraustotheca clavata]
MSDSEIQIKFLFANHDGVKVLLNVFPDRKVGDVKGTLLSMWPEDVPRPESISNIRFICMGLGALQDGKTLRECKVPSFPTHPTPVNVSVTPSKHPVQQHTQSEGGRTYSTPSPSSNHGDRRHPNCLIM